MMDAHCMTLALRLSSGDLGPGSDVYDVTSSVGSSMTGNIGSKTGVCSGLQGSRQQLELRSGWL